MCREGERVRRVEGRGRGCARAGRKWRRTASPTAAVSWWFVSWWFVSWCFLCVSCVQLHAEAVAQCEIEAVLLDQPGECGPGREIGGGKA